METYIKCPYCRTYIPADSGKCGYCGESMINNPKPPHAFQGAQPDGADTHGRGQYPPIPPHVQEQAPPPAPKPPRPNSYLAASILVTIFCCQIFGIVSIVFAAQVDSAYNRGSYEEANRLSRQASTWMYVALFSGLGIALLYLIFAVAGFSLGSYS